MDATREVKSLESLACDLESNVYCYNAYGHRQKMDHGGFEKHSIRGLDEMTFRVPIAYTAMLAMALGRKSEEMRSPLNDF